MSGRASGGGARIRLSLRSAGGGVALAATATCLALAVGASSAGASSCASGTQVFASTGSEQCYTVPTGVTMVGVAAVGAPGGMGECPVGSRCGPGFAGSESAGADGARLGGQLAVTPGETLYVEVGGAGGDATANGAGGFDGGASGFAGSGLSGGGGGGASDVRTVSCAQTSCSADPASLASRLIVASGGGGGGGGDSASGDDGGDGGGVTGATGATGTDAIADPGGAPGGGGGGATATTGGRAGGTGAGCTASAAAAGTLGGGGGGGQNTAGDGGDGGGGGGGLYGGGGGGAGCTAQFPLGAGGGGGGGSSYGPAGTAFAQDATGVPSIAIAPLTPPTATISSPPSGLTVPLGATVATAFSCAEAAGGPGIASCLDSDGTTGPAGALDTAAPGLQTYTVTATSDDGLSSSASISYTVAAPPVATIAFPASGRTFRLGRFVPTWFQCSEGSGGPGLASCVDSNGERAPRGRLDTRTLGTHTYSVTATSADGQAATTTICFTVVVRGFDDGDAAYRRSRRF